MLPSFNSKFFNKTFLSLLLLILLISNAFTADSTCTEQWSEISLDKTKWTKVGDVTINEDADSSLTFEFEQKDTSTAEIAGAVWHPYDFSKKRGILISFKPTIKRDESYFGNVKYPQGFAIVFTSSSTENLIGDKSSGLGYQGIMNAIAFEFDFVKQSTYGDAKKPHFSVNYNINGAISASTKDRTDKTCNINLPNFYDNSLDGYLKNIIFEIEIVGKKLTVRSNQEDKALVSTDFTEFQQLLEQDDVHIGITASMNQNKKITIEDFKVSEVSVNEKGNLEIDSSDSIPTIKAGEEVTLLYSIKSTCGEKLKIYSDEYSGNSLQLIINNEEIKPEVISFDETSVQLKMVVTETKENIYTALVLFQGKASSPTKFIVTSSDVNRLELCNIDEANKYYASLEDIEQSEKYFKLPLCFFDQFGNPKQASLTEIKVGYPENIKPNTLIETNLDENNRQLIVKIPFSTFGIYQIFSEEFIESKIRYVNLLPKYISAEKSDISILYDQNIIQSDTTKISLRIKPKDNYGRNIPNVILDKMQCSFDDSTAAKYDNSNPLSITQEYKDDYVLLKVDKPAESGKYIFEPRVKCIGIETTKLKCGINFETKLNNCEFYYEMSLVNTNYINVFDEYLGEYTTYSTETNEYLYISLDEKDNKRLTEVMLLDGSNSPYFQKYNKKIQAKLNNEDLTVVNIGNKYSLILPEKKERQDYTPINIHILKITFESVTFTIKVKFYFLDEYKSNTDITQTDSSKISYTAFYRQNSLTIEAAETLLLFDIYELSENKYIGLGSTLTEGEVSLKINDNPSQGNNIEIVNHKNHIAVTSHELSRVGKYKLELIYNSNTLLTINIEIIPKKEAYYLGLENGNVLDNNQNTQIGKEEHIKLIMLDKYKNPIQNNQIFNAFSKIKINKFDIFDIKLDYNGKIHIINYGKTGKSINMALLNGKEYTIESSYTPSFEDLDPLNSYGVYTGSSIITTADNKIEMTLYLRDKYGNYIEDQIKNENISIYIIGSNTKKVVQLKTEATSSSKSGIIYKASLEKNGDYEIKIFIKNIPVECKAGHFRLNYETSQKVSKATLYILDNKHKIPVLNSYQKEKENINIGLVDKNSGYFSFYLEERDSNNNEIKETKSLSFTFESYDDKSLDVSSISICAYGSNEDEKNFFKLCSGVNDAWKKLPNGLYRLMALSETLVFYLYITDSFLDATNNTPVLKYSSILLNKNEIYGKIDMPGNFILDLRNENKKRMENLEKEKISIKSDKSELKYEITSGPEKGLFTVFLLADKSGEYEFTVLYDNKQIIENTYIYYCACGFDKKLKSLGNENLNNGVYNFYQVLDSNNNECNLQYNFNELNIKEYANNLFSASDSDKKYKIETYYNSLSNILILYFDNHFPDSLTLTSNLIKFEDNSNTQTISLISNILNENHFSVKHEENKLTITPLNANYESAVNYDINKADFDISLIRIVNDNFEIIKNDFDIEDNLNINLDDSLIDATGKYIYIVYYKGKELFCENCIIDKTVDDSNSIDITKTKVYQKEGDDNYIQNEQNIIMTMNKNNLPFFKINLYTINNNLLILDDNSNIDISLKTDTESPINLDIKTKYNTNGNIYVYLTNSGREAYWNLDPMTKIVLTISNSGKDYKVYYYILDSYIKKPTSIEYCAIGAIPNIINKQDIYMKRFNEQLELEIYLEGCASEQNSIMETLDIYKKETDDKYIAELIPSDILGGYILFLPNNIPVSEINKYYILNNKAKSDIFELSVIPGYEVKKVSFKEDENMDETNSDKLYTYFLVELKDENDNIITDIGRNLFINDLNILKIDNNLPYRLIYDQKEKSFRCQVPITGNGTINASTVDSISTKDSISININYPKYTRNSLFELESEVSNKFTFSLKLFDEYYKEFNTSSLENKVSFKYFTINPLTEEVYIVDVLHNTESNKYIINLDDSLPKYSLYGFIPYKDFLPQICPSCIKRNDYPEYIYSISPENYLPHNLERSLYLIKDKDYPIYLYLSHKSSTIESINANKIELISNENTNIYLITYKDNTDSIQLNINSKIFKASFVNYSPQVEIEIRSIPPYIENYGYKIYSKNNLDNIHITFFLENRDTSGKLIITQPNLLIDNNFSGIIKRISVINTCYIGIYFVKITFSKSANIEFYPKFNQNHNKENHLTIQLNAIAAFPNDIVLSNKEIISKNIVKFNLETSNSNSEQICDERLNIYIDDMNLKNFRKVLAKEGSYCSLYIKFSGETKIKSNINNFISDINNNDRTLYNINPKFSSLTISPNVFDNNKETLFVQFQERTPAGIIYEDTEVNDNKNIYVYKYLSPNKISLIKTYSGLFSSSYPFTTDQFNLNQDNTYIIISDIVNTNMPPAFIHYRIKKAENEQKINSIKANYYSENKKAYELSNFLNSKIYMSDSFELYMPLLLKIKLLDSSGKIINIDYDKDKKLTAKLILEKDNNNIDLIVTQYDDESFLIKPAINSVPDLLHLPVYFSQSQYYFIQITYVNTTFYSLLSLKETNVQCPSIKTNYAFPNDDSEISNFQAKTYDDKTTIFIPTNIPNVQQICLVNNSSIINKHLDPYKIKLEYTTSCSDYSLVNSYMGCFALSSQCTSGDLKVNYNDKPSSVIITINNFNSDNIIMSLSDSDTKKTKEPNVSFIDLIFNEAQNIESHNFFKVFMNGDRLPKEAYSITYSQSQIKISITKSDNITSIPKNKNLMVTFEDGVNKQKKLISEEFTVSINQYNYSNSDSSYKLLIQESFDIKVGEKIYFYILLLDINDACYYGDSAQLENDILVSLDIPDDDFTAKITDKVKIEGYTQCEYIYKVEFEKNSTKSGNFNLLVEDKNKMLKEASKLYISPNEIAQENSAFFGNNKVQAGQTLYIGFSGTDSKENSINYYDLLKEFDIELFDSSDNIVKKTKEIYEYNIRVNNDNKSLNISLKIDIKGSFKIKPYYKGIVMNLPSTFKINVEYGQCSMFWPNLDILPIDQRRQYYIGETITVQIQCKDLLNNTVEEEGNEIFTANIKQVLDDKSEIKYDYKKTFLNGKHLISFTPSRIGKYSIDISLNGKKYGENKIVEINSIDKSKYTCMNKKQVDDVIDCDDQDYRNFIKDILGEIYTCTDDNTEKGFLYKCFSTDENCETDTTKCGCLGNMNKWNGYCYSTNNNPIEAVKNNINKITCLNKIKSTNPSAEVFKCEDGTCRYNLEECNTIFECPIGYRSCGNKCILLSETCSLESSCTSDEISCWDLSCAKNYDLCPTRITCPNGKVLCPDGSCQLSGHCAQPLIRSCSAGQYQCADFSCVESKDDCKKNPVCEPGLSLCENGECKKSCQDITEPENKFRCSNGKYVDNSKLCPSDIFTPSGYIKCPNGGIALNNKECDYVQGGISITCPNSKPILCPDLSCVSSSNECNTNYIPTCPPHKPYQCWNNECRKSFEECPTPISCPSESPVLCQNGFCVKTSDECTEKQETTCPRYRCYDGTCVNSIELCPTHIYCGKNQIRCWNGACVNSINECRSTSLDSCPSTFPFRCPDGSCRGNEKACSTISVCPPDLPIKCFDNSCRASINECPLYQTCGENKVSCPDGTCALTYDECNTMVTCRTGYPFLCSDNSCRAQLSDCPIPPKCSKTEVLCPNGACVSSRQNCKTFDACESTYPIRCEANTCTDAIENCSLSKKRCPEGYVQCGNGECKASGYLCEAFECPKNKPFMCPEGVCVHDESLCDIKDNGCPYNKPYKCLDGTCVDNESNCNKEFSCSNGKKLCPDGSCISNEDECPLINGCYKDRPFKCADGTCINTKTTSCSPVLCPPNVPYKCPYGNCVENSADCSDDLFELDSDCEDGLLMCADGRCVESTDYCRPVFACESSYHKCFDGTCRVSKDLCPQNVQCPKSRPYRCDDDICVKSSGECESQFVCLDGKMKCENDGLCKSNKQECKNEPNTDNICMILNKQMCKNGRCINSNDDCSLVSDACPDEDAPYLCPNGECTKDLTKCEEKTDNTICDEGKFLCESGRCVENKKEIIRAQCTNNIGCPLDRPYRCSNGECAKSERNCQVTSIINGVLYANIICDESKPYLCDDRTCVADTNFCKVSFECDSGMKKCNNGYCVSENENCTIFSGYCPEANPIHCPSGTCVDDIIKCTTAFNIPSCNEGEFYCVRMNKCLKNKLDCLLYLETAIEKSTTINNNIRLLNQDFENIANPLNDEEFIKLHKNKNKIISLKEEEDDKDKGIDKIEGTICYDGTIVTGDEKCPIVPACKIGQYRCENGACASDKSLCPIDDSYICLPGQKKCPDGFCHKDCSEVAFHGCEVNQYQCSNGQCLEDKYDCIGHSMCSDPAYPFRCISGECKSDPEECENIERLGNVKNLTYSFNKLNKIKFNFAYDTNGHNVANLEIPSNALKFSNKYSKIFLKEVSSSLLKDSSLYNNTAEFIFNVSNSITGSEGVLNFENSVMSPVFKFYSKESDIIFKFPGIINIAHNEYESNNLYYYDYCLAKLKGFDLSTDKLSSNSEDNGWECVQRQSKEGQTEFSISEFGVYAVILNPMRNKTNYFANTEAKNFFLENIKVILIVVACVVVVIALVFYIFIRVTRYRKKYHANREKIILLKQQREEYENMTTDIFGQTLGDNMNGIIYKANPAYTVSDEIKKAGTSLEDEIERLQIECKNVSEQNERLQKDIEEVTKKYEKLSESIENMNK